MEDGLERIAFLANSTNRVEILERLAETACEPPELRAEIGASRTTVSRALNEFESRGWIEHHGNGYETTTLGQIVVEEFSPLLESMERVAVLEEVVKWLPTEQMSLNLYELGDGDLVSPSQKNLSSHIEAGMEAVRNADHVRVLGNAVIPIYIKVIRDCVVEGGLIAKQVYGRKAMEMMVDHEHMSGQIKEIIDSGAPVYRFAGVIPYNLLILDDSVLFFLCDETSLPESLLVTENDTVVTWAESTFQSYRTDAELLNQETIIGT